MVGSESDLRRHQRFFHSYQARWVLFYKSLSHGPSVSITDLRQRVSEVNIRTGDRKSLL